MALLVGDVYEKRAVCRVASASERCVVLEILAPSGEVKRRVGLNRSTFERDWRFVAHCQTHHAYRGQIRDGGSDSDHQPPEEPPENLADTDAILYLGLNEEQDIASENFGGGW